ncbi:MAG TPA: stage V sporulation protein R, partial [Xanthomarina gelatinilytica]|nr:stage V sporulation protein R [Xanthomarina gelatinilytica]
HTDPDNVIARFKAAGKRVQQYIEDPSIGIEKVERILDACHAIQYQIPRTPGISRLSEEDAKKEIFRK